MSARTGLRLAGRRVVITGASGGIGFEAAKRFAREGAKVALIARSQPGLAEAVRQVERDGGQARALVADVADRPALEAAIAQAADWLGGIDVVVPNAGVAGYGPFDELSPADFDRTVAVTFTGAVDTVRAALPHLERSGGTVVATVSIASKVPLPLLSPYVAAKHALRGCLGSLRIELRQRGSKVRVCMVHPGPIDTRYYAHATSATGTQPKPLRSTYSPESVAQALVECAVRPRAEVTVGSAAAALAVMSAVARPLSDLVLSTYGSGARRPRARRRGPGPFGELRDRDVFAADTARDRASGPHCASGRCGVCAPGAHSAATLGMSLAARRVLARSVVAALLVSVTFRSPKWRGTRSSTGSTTRLSPSVRSPLSPSANAP